LETEEIALFGETVLNASTHASAHKLSEPVSFYSGSSKGLQMSLFLVPFAREAATDLRESAK
jgi:hypothetical protein